MANNFKPWVDSPTAGQEVQSVSVFASDTQRIKGFKAGGPASALRVNSALRQANLVVASIMQMCDEIVTLPQDLGLLSTVTQVKTAIKAAIDKLDTTVLNTAKSYTDALENTTNTKIADLQSQVTSNKNSIDSHTTHLSEIDEEIATLEGGSSTLTDRVGTLETKMTTAQSDITSIKQKDTNQDTLISGLRTDVDALTPRVTTAENNINALQKVYKITISSWSGSGTNLSYVINASTHGCGTTPNVRTYYNNEEVYNSPKVDASGNVTIYTAVNVNIDVVITR